MKVKFYIPITACTEGIHFKRMKWLSKKHPKAKADADGILKEFTLANIRKVRVKA